MVLNQLRIYSLKLAKKRILCKFSPLEFIGNLKSSEIFLIFPKIHQHSNSPTVVDIESDIGLITCSSGTTGPSKCEF